MSRPPRARLTIVLRAVFLVAALAGCLPYTVGGTAQPVPRGEVRRAAMFYVVPNAVDLLGDSVSGALAGADLEARWGHSDALDFGLRLPSLSGLVLNSKYRVWGRAGENDAAIAVLSGVGVVNWGVHAHLELGLLASASMWRQLTPYGGLRVMQVIPLGSGGPHDSPTAGGVVGIRIGSAEFGFSPELAIYHDRSTLGLRDRHVIFVPAVTLHGDLFSRLVGTGTRQRRAVPRATQSFDRSPPGA